MSVATGTGHGEWLRSAVRMVLADLTPLYEQPGRVMPLLAAELRAIADELDPSKDPAGAPNARLLTAREVAGILGTTPDWVRARARDWPFARRIGRWWRFEAEGVRRWTESQTERRRRASGG